MGGLIAVAIAAAIAIGGPDDGTGYQPQPDEQLERVNLGQGAEAVTVVAWSGIEGPAPTVIFLHGWGELGADKYRSWIDHLARAGNVVIVPRYQTSSASPPEDVLSAALAGIRSATEAYPVAPESLVVAGHSAGAALAADYTAMAANDPRLPRPVAVYAVYPGRAILGTGGIPPVDPAAIPRSTRIVAMGSPTDTVVGEGPAIELAESAVQVPLSRRRFVEVTNPSVSDHYAPLRDSKAARDAFWQPLDALIRSVR